MEPREQAAQLPEGPGVYLFKDASWEGYLCRESACAVQSRALVFSGIALYPIALAN